MPSTLNDVPLATQSLAVSQPPIRANFDVISRAFVQDHVNYNITSGDASQGMHQQVTLPRNPIPPSVTPDSTTTGTNVAIYAKVGATSGVTEAVFRRQGNGQIIPFTESLNAATGWTRLPSGIILVWGTGNITSNNPAITVTFPQISGQPPFQAGQCFNVTAISTAVPALDNKCIQVGQITEAGFQIFSRSIGAPGSNTGSFNYLAIGLGR